MDSVDASSPNLPMKKHIILVVFALGLGVSVFAAETNYPPITFMPPPHQPRPMSNDQFVVLVVEGDSISYDKNPVPRGAVVDYVNDLLKRKGVSNLAVHIREGVKFGDMVKALDALRHTKAQSISVSMVPLPIGREI